MSAGPDSPEGFSSKDLVNNAIKGTVNMDLRMYISGEPGSPEGFSGKDLVNNVIKETGHESLDSLQISPLD